MKEDKKYIIVFTDLSQIEIKAIDIDNALTIASRIGIEHKPVIFPVTVRLKK